MDIRLVETRHVLNGKGKTGVVGLTRDVIDQGLLSKVVHDPRGEVALQASRRWYVDFEARVSEGTSRDTAATSMTSDVQWILLGSCFNIRSISPESVCGIKYGCLVDGSAAIVGQRCVERPIPVSVKYWLVHRQNMTLTSLNRLRLASFISTLLSQSLLICRDEVSMPQDEMSLPLVSSCLRDLVERGLRTTQWIFGVWLLWIAWKSSKRFFAGSNPDFADMSWRHSTASIYDLC